MSQLRHDLTLALRRFRHSPAFSFGAIAILALAIGAAAAIYTLVHAILLRPLALRDPGRLAVFSTIRPDNPRWPISLPNLQEYRAAAQTLEAVEACFQWSANLTGGGDAERIQGMRVTPRYLEVLGAEAALGRVFGAADTDGGAAAVAVIGHGLWRRRFGGTPDVVGQSVVLNGQAFTIVGVLRPDFPFQIRDAEIVAPFPEGTDPRRQNRALGFLRTVARVKPGVSLDLVKEDLDAVARRLSQAFPASNGSDQGVRVVSLQAELVGDTSRLLGLLFGAVCLVLIVASANLANLVLIRGGAVRRDLALRTALGATRGRLLRQLLTEAVVLAGAGAAAGLLVARLGVAVLLAISPATLPRAAEVAPGWSSAAFAGAAAALSVLLFGLLPALQLSSRAQLAGVRRTNRPVSADGRRVRAVLVGLEVALAVVLVFAAGLLARSMIRLQRIDPGLEPAGVLTLRLSLPRARYQTTGDIDRFRERLEQRLASLPGVRAAGAGNVVPFNGYLATIDFQIEGRPRDAGPLPVAHYRMVSPGYFAALGIRHLAGRPLDAHDGARGAPVAIVNQAMADRYWPSGSPVGARVRLNDATPGPPRTVEIVGVCASVRHFGLEREPVPEVYVPIPQVPDPTSIWLANNMYWIVGGSVSPSALAGGVRREVAAVDPQVPASFVRTMDEWIETSVGARRFNLRLVLFFAASAVLLATIGVYTVASSAAAQRTREMGIRAALGATPLEIARLIVTSAMAPVSAGLAAGIVAALATAPLMAGMLFETGPAQPGILAGVAVVLGAAGLLAAGIPAGRARRADPIASLRAE